ncbi:MAG: ABC transporter ATP-binding protein [Patescibacteria group bacterium]|nr:ABC transporter ATP-binding protein [Patescibacteria group bacterium]
MIQVENAVKVYELGEEKIRALDDIDLKVSKGEFVALVGPSGSGKSTLMNVIGALDVLDNGRIMVNGEDISRYSELKQAEYRRKSVGFVFQTFNLQNRLTALENVELPLLFEGIPARERKKRATAALEKVGLAARVKHCPSELSGGEQQRVSVARAIVNNPTILLADEPTGNLDSQSGKKIMELFKMLNRSDGMTVIMVTHNEDHAKFATLVHHMRDGKIVSTKDKNHAAD